VRGVVILERQADLLEIVRALHPPRRLACLLHCRQQQGDQHANNGNHHQQLHQRKTPDTSHMPNGRHG
jgi:hypothetical protein